MSPLEQAWLLLKQYVPYAHEARSMTQEDDPYLQALRRESEAAELEEYRQELMRQGRVPSTYDFPPADYQQVDLPTDPNQTPYIKPNEARMERMPPPLSRRNDFRYRTN